MHCGQVTHKIEEAILTGSYSPLELLVRERHEILVEATDHKLPRVDRGYTEEFFVCHFDLLPCLL